MQVNKYFLRVPHKENLDKSNQQRELMEVKLNFMEKERRPLSSLKQILMMMKMMKIAKRSQKRKKETKKLKL
jgi:hypothetical protein